MDEEFSSIGEVLFYFKKNNINNIDKRAEYVQNFINKSNNKTGYEYDRYIEFGSSNFANVITENSGKKKECILWCVNHYLSLNRNTTVIEKSAQALLQYGTGCGTSAASCGMSSLHKEIQKKIAQLVGKEKVLLFPTGFTANTAAISFLAGKQDLILFDRECHSSIINGLKLTEAKWISFQHNNLKDLTAKLRKYANSFQNIFVIVESAYSMSGDLAPLQEIVALKDIFNFFLYVDEAHTFGLYGEQGQGFCHAQGVTDKVDFIMATLSKATASIGGFVAAEEKYCSLLKWSDPYVFQACIPPADAATILACLDEIERNPVLISALHEKNRYMRELLTERGFNLGTSKSPIIPIFIEDHQKLQMVVRELYEEGIYSTPICFPAVKVNEGRIRLILNAAHTKEHINTTVDTLERICTKYQVIGASNTAQNSQEIFEETIEHTFFQTLRKNAPNTLMIMAVDDFAQIKEKFSAHIGESVLEKIASLLKASCREADALHRYGEDAFALLLAGTGALDDVALCDRLVRMVEEYDWSKVALGLKVTVSIGMGNIANDNPTASALEQLTKGKKRRTVVA